MVGEKLISFGLVASLIRIQHALKWCLGVNDHVLAAGYADDQIWAKRTAVGRAERLLLEEVTVLHHPRQLDHVAQLSSGPTGRGHSACAAP